MIPSIIRGNVDAGDLVLAQGNILVGDAGGNAAALDASGDTKVLVGNATTITSVALSSDATMANTGAVTIANDAINEAKTADSDGTSGLYVAKYALATYDFATDGGVAGAITLTDAVTIPDNAVCELVNYDVITTCTSGTDAATIKLNLVTDGDLSTAIAISDGTNPWDAGAHLGSVVTPVIAKTTGARLLQITVAGGENLTAGKIVFCVRYWVSS